MAEKQKSKYRQIRDDLGWSREKAAEELAMSDDKLERIENESQLPNPQDVLMMSEVYQAPELCNYFCHNICEIGQMYIPEAPLSELPSIILHLLDSIYAVDDIEKILVKITADNNIEDKEIEDLVNVQYVLENLATMISALKICIERKKISGEISKNIYDKAWKKRAEE